MDLLQIITGLLCFGAIVCLAYQIKELYHAFKDSNDFKHFLANKNSAIDYMLHQNENLYEGAKNVAKENEKFQQKITNLKCEIAELEEENRKLKKKLPSSYWL